MARVDVLAWPSRLLTLIVAVAVVFGDVLPLERGLMFRDHALVFRPRWWAVADALAHGEWPALTHANTSGVPLELLLNATWTPTTLLFTAGPFDATYDLFVATQYLVLASGMLLLAKRLGATRDQALIAAATATLAGPIVACENLVVMLQGLAWLPWVALGLYTLATRPSLAGVGGTALALGFHLQGITPVVMVLDVALGVGLAAYLRPSRKSLAFALIAGVMGFVIAAVELLPVLIELRSTERGQGFEYAMQSGWALHPAMLIELWSPSFWAPPEHPLLNVPWATGLANDPPYFTTLYLGTALSVALAGGLARRAQRWLWVGLVLTVLVAMGEHTPLHRWLVSLPILSSGRYAVKYTLLTTACLAPLVALALPVIREQPRRLIIVGIAHVGLLVSIYSVVASAEYSDFLLEAIRPIPIGIRFQGGSMAELASAMIDAQQARLLVSLASALALAVLGVAIPRARSWGPALVATVVVVDLALAGASAVRGADLEAQALPAPARAAMADDFQRFWVEVPGGVNPPVAHREGVTPFDDMMRSTGQRGQRPLGVARLWSDQNLDRQSLPDHLQAFNWVVSSRRPEAYTMMARLGVARIVSPVPDLPLEHRLTWPVEGETPQHLYSLPGVRAYVSAFTAWRARPLGQLTPPEYHAHMTEPALQGVALVTHGLTTSATVASCPAPPVTWSRPLTGRVLADVNSACESLVVVQEVALPGWEVWIDDQPRPLLRAEAGFLAVRVPAGRHSLRFEYSSRSASFRALSVGAGLIALILLAWGLLEARLAGAGRGGMRPM
ncbi:MAG: hypothetical protein H6730_09945 [Deltaproteobacteria bacterium]|nr:hypothetical protein [Deltaproteobacteria bacterium]